MSQLRADLPAKSKVLAYDPSPLRRPAVTPQWKWAEQYVRDQRVLQRTQFLGFTNFKIMSRERKGLAELFRIIFSYADISYEDVILNNLDWKSLICKMPYGNLPVLWMDHNAYGEPNAIIRLLARHLNLMGASEAEVLTTEAVLQQVSDLKESDTLQKAFEELQTRADEIVEQAFTILLPDAFMSWEDRISEHDGPFILKSGISLADLAIFDFLNQYRCYLPLDDLLGQYSLLVTQYEAVMKHPRLEATYFRKYYQMRPEMIVVGNK